MTVNDLIEELQNLVQDGYGGTPVHFAYPAGDYWKTTAAPCAEYAEPGRVEHSEQLNMPKQVNSYDDDGEEMFEEPNAVIIRG